MGSFISRETNAQCKLPVNTRQFLPLEENKISQCKLPEHPRWVSGLDSSNDQFFLSKGKAVFFVYGEVCKLTSASSRKGCKILLKGKEVLNSIQIVAGEQWKKALQREYPNSWRQRIDILGFMEKRSRKIWVNRSKQGPLTLIHELVHKLQNFAWFYESHFLNEGITELYTRKLADVYNKNHEEKIIYSDDEAYFIARVIAEHLEKLIGEDMLAESYFNGIMQPVKEYLNNNIYFKSNNPPGFSYLIQNAEKDPMTIKTLLMVSIEWSKD